MTNGPQIIDRGNGNFVARSGIQPEPTVKVGDRIKVPGSSEVRVMAIAEGHAMVRCKGAIPHIRTVKALAAAKAAS